MKIDYSAFVARVHDMIADFWHRYGVRPTHLFCPGEVWSEFGRSAQEQMSFLHTPHPEPDRIAGLIRLPGPEIRVALL